MEFVYHELVTAIVPRAGLPALFAHWPEIVSDLAESKRKRQRQSPALG